MVAKKVSIGSKPVDKVNSADSWVASRAIESEVEKVKTKRFTIDVPEPSHRAFKQICAGEGVTMAEKINNYIEEYISKKHD